MPRVGFGTATATLGQAEGRAGVTEAILGGLDAGYRHFDTAAVYNTKASLGDAVAEAVRAGTVASRDGWPLRHVQALDDRRVPRPRPAGAPQDTAVCSHSYTRPTM